MPPWEKYQQSEGPWQKYTEQTPEEPPMDVSPGMPDEAVDLRPTGRLPKIPGENARPMTATQELYNRRFTPGPTLDQELTGTSMDPNLPRNALIPFYRTQPYEKGGPFFQGIEYRPSQIMVDLYRGFKLPGHAAQGGSYTPEDVTKMALDYNPMQPVARGTPRPTASEFRSAAKTAEALQEKGSTLFDRATKSGVRGDPDKFISMVDDVTKMSVKHGADDVLTQEASRVMKLLEGEKGVTPSLDDLQRYREWMGMVADSLKPREASIGMKMQEHLDDYIDNLSGLPKEARRVWHQMRKTETIERAIDRAELSASGFENGLRAEFRSLLKNDRKMRGFTDAEKKAMTIVVNGGALRNFWRTIRHLGPGRGQENRYLGTAVGGTVGYALGGPGGAAAATAGGHLAGRAAERSTANAADMARAIAAQGGRTPLLDTATRRLARKSVLPMLGTQVRGPNGGWMVDGEEFF